MHASSRFATLVIVAASWVGCGPTCPGDADLRAAVAALGAGQTYVLDDRCVVHAGLELSSGATLEGGTYELVEGQSLHVIASSAAPTTLAHVHVRSTSSAAAIVVDGAGAARVSDVDVVLDSGIGIGVREGEVTLEDVTIEGDVDPANVLELPVPADPSTLATFGVVVVGGRVSLARADVRHVATAGVLCESAELDVDASVIAENRGVGIEGFSCVMGITSTEVFGTLSAPGLPGLGVVAAATSTLTSSTLTVRDEPGFGVLVDGSSATLSAPTIARLGLAGVHARNAASVDVRDGTFTAVAGSGILSIGASRIAVARTTIADTTPAPILTPGGAGSMTMADGIHVVQDATVDTTIRIDDTTLRNNARIGAVVDGATRSVDLVLTAVRVEGSGAELGLVAQNVAALPAGWDADVIRVGSPLTLDGTAPLLAVSTGSGALGILMPPTISF